MKRIVADRITADPTICHGEPCIEGTRIMISVILDCLADGMDRKSILEEYPELSEEDIAAVLSYASRVVKVEEDILHEAEVG